MLTLPPATARALGDEAAPEFARWLDDTMRERAVPRDEYRTVLSRLEIIEHDLTDVKARLDKVELRFDALEERFDARLDALQRDTNARFDALQRDMNARFDAMNARFDTVNERIDTIHDVVRSQTRWLVGTLVALGGLISVLLTVFEFIK